MNCDQIQGAPIRDGPGTIQARSDSPVARQVPGIGDFRRRSGPLRYGLLTLHQPEAGPARPGGNVTFYIAIACDISKWL